MSVTSFRQALLPYKDILLFAITLLAAHFSWKYTVLGDEGSEAVMFFGNDISAPFIYLSNHIALVVFYVLDLFRDTVHLHPNSIIRFDSGSGISIAWSCTAIKQSFIWICIMLTTPKGWRHKIWFIPFGLVVIYVFNILRISAIALLIEYHPDWFDILHDYVFKYIFYIVLFLLWVWFVQHIRTRGLHPNASADSVPNGSTTL